MNIHLAVRHVDAGSENHVSAPDVHRLNAGYRIFAASNASIVIYTAMVGESYPRTRVDNYLVCINAKIPLTGVNPASAITHRFVEIANFQLIIPT